MVNGVITLYGSEQRCGNHVASFDCEESEEGYGTRTMKWQAIHCLKLSSALHTPHCVCHSLTIRKHILFNGVRVVVIRRSEAEWSEKVNIIVIAGATPRQALCAMLTQVGGIDY